MKFSILYAEDDPEDRQLFMDAIAEMDISVEIIEAENGDQLLQYLYKVKEPAALPGAIISDLRMPIKDGLDVLKAVKEDPKLKHIPFILFTTSSTKADLNKAMQLGADGFFSKPGTYMEIINTVNKALVLCFNLKDTSLTS